MKKKGQPRATRKPDCALTLFRLASGLRQRDLAESAGISQELVSALETGARRPTLDIARALARVLGVDVAEIFPNLERPAEKAEASRARRG